MKLISITPPPRNSKRKKEEKRKLNYQLKIIGLLLAVILVINTCSGSGDLFTEESAFNTFKTSYYPQTSGARGENISVSIMNLKSVSATYAFDISAPNARPPSWLTIDSNTGIISGKVPENASVSTTKYIVKITPTGEYSSTPEQRLDFVLTLKIADFPGPLRLNVEGMILKKHGNATERSGNSMVVDANDSKLTVKYSYSSDNATAQPSWLSLNQNTGAIVVNDANKNDLPDIGDTKTYKIRITGTGIYEGKTSDLDFIISSAALAIPAGISYGNSTTIAKGSNVNVHLRNAIGGFTATYAFDISAPNVPPPSWLSIDANTGTISGMVPANTPVATTAYRINIHGTGVYKGEVTSRLFTLEVTPAALPTTLAYDFQTFARESYVSQTIKGGGGASSSSFTYAFAATPEKPVWLNIDLNTGTISGIVPATESVGATTYKIIVNGGSGSIYDGATLEIDFTLTISTLDVCSLALSVNCSEFEQAYIKASNTSQNDYFGYSIALSSDGNTLAVGAYFEDSNATGIDGDQNNNDSRDSGAVYVFTRSSSSTTTTWSQQAYIKASNTDSSDHFGYSIALSSDGNTLAVGARDEDSNATGIGGDQTNNSASESGAVYVFTRSITTTTTTWSQQAYIKASNTDSRDAFGYSVALSSDGNTLAVGARSEGSNATGVGGNESNDSSTRSGAVYVFTRSGSGTTTTWSQQAYIKASNTESYDYFGSSIALSSDGNTLAVGAYSEGSNATGVGGTQTNNDSRGSGAVYVFTRSSSSTTTTWSQQAYIKSSNTGIIDYFGSSVALSSDGNTLAVGAIYEDSSATGVDGNETNDDSSNSGAVYVFIRSSTTTTWSQQAYIKASNTDSRDLFGYSVALSSDGNTLAVGAYYEDSNATGVNGDQTYNSLTSSGAAYVFTRSSTTATWSQQAYIKASNTGSNDHFGYSISLSPDGKTLAVGAFAENSSATGVNGDQTDNRSVNSGAVYIRRIAP